MTAALIILAVQTLFGALDNVLHHEITERLASRPSARRELALHSAREAIYGALFLIFAWSEPSGVLAAVVLVLLLIEIVITIADFIEEDRSRHLPPFERLLHTVLAILYGAFLAMAVPWLLVQTGRESGLAFVSYGALSWFFTLAALGVLAFALRNAHAVRALGKWRAPCVPGDIPSSGRSVLVTGATGFIGSALVERLLARGDRVFVLTRDARQARAIFGERAIYVESLAALPPETRIEAVVNLAGAPIIGLPWFAVRRREIRRSRIDLTEALDAWMSTLERKPGVLVSGSAIGFYGDRGDATLDETQTAGQGFGAELCAAWENAAVNAQGIRTVCLRIGLVLDRAGGPLPMMALPVRLGCGAMLGSGRQWLSWITRDDLLRMILAAIDDVRWQGPVNAVAPEPARHADFQRALARTLRRALFLRVPAVVLRALLGEMSSLFLFSQRVVPATALALGFAFDVWWIADALALQLGPRPAALPMAGQGLPSPASPVDTAPQLAIATGDAHDDHDSRRSPVPLRAQSAGGAGRKRAGL
jgi:uncharacterized protein